MPDYRALPENFHVAFSFAGAQRDLVRAAAERVEASLGRGTVFFDEWFEHIIAGDDADLRLQDIYSKRASLIVVCVSKAYSDRPWTVIEHRVIRTLTMSSARDTDGWRVLPLRFGDGDVPGIYINAIVPDVRARSAEDTARLIIARFEHLSNSVTLAAENQAATAAVKPVPEDAPAPVRAAQRTLAELVTELCSSDPVVAMEAASALAQRDEAIDAIVGRAGASMESIPLAAVRMAMRGKQAAAAALSARVLDAESNWHSAIQAAHDLDQSHAPYCADELGRLFAPSERDRKKVLYRALGNLGAITWGWELFSFFADRHERRTYAASALESLTSMFRHARRSEVDHASSMLREAVELDERKNWGGYSSLSMRHVLGQCTGDHVDTWLKDWVTADSARIRGIAADALGDCRIRRSIPTLEKLLGDSDAGVREAATRALGAIETEQSHAALMRSAPDSSGAAFTLHLIADDSEFRSAARNWLDQATFLRWVAVRSIGLRGAAEFVPDLRKLLDSSNELERGCALLALARLGDASDLERIDYGMREASGSSFEKVMAILAWITASPERYVDVEASLRANLADHSSFFWQPAQRDIITVLESLDNPQAARLARAWRPFYSQFRGELTGAPSARPVNRP